MAAKAVEGCRQVRRFVPGDLVEPPGDDADAPALRCPQHAERFESKDVAAVVVSRRILAVEVDGPRDRHFNAALEIKVRVADSGRERPDVETGIRELASGVFAG